MEYKVVAKEGIRIPFKFLREGSVFNASKTPLSKTMIAELVMHGKIAKVGGEDTPPAKENVITPAKPKQATSKKNEVKDEAIQGID
jgi:hypothetical protein